MHWLILALASLGASPSITPPSVNVDPWWVSDREALNNAQHWVARGTSHAQPFWEVTSEQTLPDPWGLLSACHLDPATPKVVVLSSLLGLANTDQVRSWSEEGRPRDVMLGDCTINVRQPSWGSQELDAWPVISTVTTRDGSTLFFQIDKVDLHEKMLSKEQQKTTMSNEGRKG